MILRRFFTLYGINPGIQFGDNAFKEEFISEVTKVITTYYPALSREAMELAIELNLTNHFGLEKKPDVYGDRITATFLTDVLSIYRSKKGMIIQKLERMLPAEENPPNIETTNRYIEEMLEEDYQDGLKTGVFNLRMPALYYDLLIRKGLIIETDDMVKNYGRRAREIFNQMKGIAKRKEAAPLDLKQLDITRTFLKKPVDISRIAKSEAVTDYLTNLKEAK